MESDAQGFSLEAPTKRSKWTVVRTAQVGLALAIASSIPAGIVAAYSFGADRNDTGDAVAVAFFLLFVALLTTPWWPTRGPLAATFEQRLQSTCMIWFGLTFTTHLTWELGWVVLRQRIIASPHEPWAFVWWMYIDGGDRRYASGGTLMLAIELLSVCNGLVGALALWWRSRVRVSSTSAVPILMLGATAVVHVYSALLYLLTEALGEYPNVDTTSFVDLVIKFWALNGLWIAMPCAVFLWVSRQLRALEHSLRM